MEHKLGGNKAILVVSPLVAGAIATMREENTLFFKGISPLYCGKGFRGRKKLSLPRHSTVAMFSLATEVEELNIEALTLCFFSLYG